MSLARYRDPEGKTPRTPYSYHSLHVFRSNDIDVERQRGFTKGVIWQIDWSDSRGGARDGTRKMSAPVCGAWPVLVFVDTLLVGYAWDSYILIVLKSFSGCDVSKGASDRFWIAE